MTTAATTPTNSLDSNLDISEKFIEENKDNLCQSVPSTKFKKSGPWTQHDKEARRAEIHKLHFEYAFSARQIADFLGISRNTVNSDLRYHYSTIVTNNKIVDPEVAVGIGLARLDIQYARLRQQLDKTDSQEERNPLEKLMLDIVSKSMSANQRMAESYARMINLTTQGLNDWMKDHKKDTRYISMHDRQKVSSSAHKKIERIIKEDQKIGDPDLN